MGKVIFVVLIIIIFLSQLYGQESSSQVFDLYAGWNQFSLNVSPTSDEFIDIFSEQISADIQNTVTGASLSDEMEVIVMPNGIIEVYDAALILRFNLGMITEFPIE